LTFWSLTLRVVATDTGILLAALRDGGYRGPVAYEMCSPLRGGGSIENLDRCARKFLEYMAALSD
jgi:hypothetical protein